MIELKGFYNEAVLHDLLAKGEIGYLDYVMHLSEEIRDRYKDYCSKNNLQLDDESAEKFFGVLVEEENKVHEQYMT